MKAELLLDCANILGEGIQWSVPDQRLYWTDIQASQLWSCDEFGQNVVVKDLPERLCSFAFDLDGHMLCAFASGLYRLNVKTEACELLSLFEPDLTGTRLNDGRCDRLGRFIVGGYHEAGPEAISSVISYADEKVIPLIQNVKCTNGLCFSADGRNMYFTDTATKIINRFDYDPDTGALSNKVDFAVLGDEDGSPDGSCLDGEDAIWNAQFRGARVQRFLKDGTRDICVDVPAPNVTCVCFGGADLDTLFITTARHKMTDDQLAQSPQAGGVFFVKPDVCGFAENRYKGHLFP
ncbi:MAG: SMP-30/gluconolactonase/LRE family protein [Methylocystaceae bacterium]|nr:SMP-30/gluconolactonase/LRE family protein [Methylocystaceae bacterium]